MGGRLTWRHVSAAFLLSIAGPAAPLAGQVIDTLALRDHARILADDSMLGRDTGSDGERAAAAYIAGRLEASGLEPAGDAYRIPLPLRRIRLSDSARLRLRAAGEERIFEANRDFVLANVGRSGLRGFDGRAVLIGRTDEAPPPERLAGRVVVTIGPLGQPAADVLRDWARVGVAGVIVPAPDDAMTADRAAHLVIDGDVDDPVWQPALPIVYAGTSLTRALLAGVSPDTLPSELRPDVEAALEFTSEPVASANVFGFVRGTDAVLRDEMILLTAHYDHLGTGEAVDGDSIYNGFSDNAAGVAMLLEIARALYASPAPRSVGFLFTSGEEKGLLGATYFAQHPPFPLARIHAVLNLDAGAPPAPPVRWRVAGDTMASAMRAAADVVRSHGWIADLTAANANSDHWPFMARGVATVFLVPGREWEGLDDTARDALFARWDHYHQPGDEWRPGFPLSGIGRYADLALAITRTLATR